MLTVAPRLVDPWTECFWRLNSHRAQICSHMTQDNHILFAHCQSTQTASGSIRKKSGQQNEFGFPAIISSPLTMGMHSKEKLCLSRRNRSYIYGGHFFSIFNCPSGPGSQNATEWHCVWCHRGITFVHEPSNMYVTISAPDPAVLILIQEQYCTLGSVTTLSRLTLRGEIWSSSQVPSGTRFFTQIPTH